MKEIEKIRTKSLEKFGVSEKSFEKLDDSEKRKIETKIFLIEELEKIKNKKQLSELMRFHAGNKYLYFCYDINKKDELGRIVANSKNKNLVEVFETYKKVLLEILDQSITDGRKINAYSHIFGYFRNDLSEDERADYFRIMNEFEKTKGSDLAIRNKLFEFSKKYKKEYISNQFILKKFWWE